MIAFVLSLPVVLLVTLFVAQTVRLGYAQFRLEALAAHVARRLAVEPSSAPQAGCDALIAAGRGTLTCRATRRKVADIDAAAVRRPRAVEVIEIDLLEANGPSLAPGAGPTSLKAHAREACWGNNP